MRKNLQAGDCNLNDLPYDNLSPRNRRKLVRLATSLTEVKPKEKKKEEFDVKALVDEMEKNDDNR
jgi:hypothetical protein